MSKKVKSQTQSPQKRPSLAHHWIDFSLDLHTFLLNFYFASKLNQLVISPLIDQEFPFLIRRGRRREHYTLLSPNFNPKLCRSSKGPFIFCDISSFFFSYHLLVLFFFCLWHLSSTWWLRCKYGSNHLLSFPAITKSHALFASDLIASTQKLIFFKYMFLSLCMGPPLARAYNYVKFIETGGGEVARGR